MKGGEVCLPLRQRQRVGSIFRLEAAAPQANFTVNTPVDYEAW